MRLLRIGPPGRERPAVAIDGERAFDAASIARDYDGRFFATGGLERLRAAVDDAALPVVALAGQRLGAPIARPGKIVCVGLNYADHAREAAVAPPEEPVLFLKASDTVIGPYDDVLLPPGSAKTDYEVELGVVIGTTARYLRDEEQALACVAGYAVSHDVSERAFQFEHGGQWDKGKSCETFNPLGPWMVTSDEAPDPTDMRLRLLVNGASRQESTTAEMLFGVARLVHYVSQFMVLHPGDLLNTGTPAGVGMAFEPPRFLAEGDVVEAEIEGIGRQRQVVVRAEAAA